MIILIIITRFNDEDRDRGDNITITTKTIFYQIHILGGEALNHKIIHPRKSQNNFSP